MPLHTDLRPTTFSEVVGNNAVVKSLQNKLSKEDRPHCYMFEGASGCGKTTLARICASELEISELDVHELNIGNTRGIDDARDIISLMQERPWGKATVIIIDEAHNSTKQFQEALLKPLEDCPDHVYVFVATTEPNKFLTTFRRRFVEFKVKKLTSDDILMYLLKVCKDRQQKVVGTVLDKITSMADGSLGVALVALETMFDISASEQLELIESAEKAELNVINLCQALLRGKSWGTVIGILQDMDENPESNRRIIMKYMQRVLMSKNSSATYKQASNIIGQFSEYMGTQAEFVASCYIVGE